MFPKARQALVLYFSLAKDKVPFVSANDLIEHYRTHYYGDGSGFVKHDDFLEEFDKAIGYAGNKNNITTAMKKLADKTPKGKAPKNEAFFNALSDQVAKFTFGDAVAATTAGLKDAVVTVTAGAGAGIAVYLMVAFAGVYVLAYMNSKVKLPK